MKKLLALLLALALTLSFTGCHGTLASGENPAASSSYPVPDEFDTSRRYEVTFWAKKRHQHGSGEHLQAGHCGL